MASRKLFLGFASGLVSRFVSRNNDIRGYWGVGILSRHIHETGSDTIEFDLLNGHDSELDAGSASWLRHQMRSTNTPGDWLQVARLEATYTPRESDPGEELWPAWIDKPTGVPMYRVVASATLTDDHGRLRQATAHTWCWDHDPKRERRSAREVLDER